ncbi:Adenine deaminase [Clostridium acidisoli DSM 12555]|uniref:Adenine deaminase n=1 Tax=Clostridium acidisoli DSM 12555 TaxID=1121291 RepID=A0A1W1XGY0_9CLOT|nr:adenine deaminase [Clostridium acidisoli]SMC22771.1 Adenine deaminase [Clostridium acidisoli DSM 12555]
MSVEMKQKRINLAMKREKADLVIKNANIINVFTKEIIRGDIAIYKDQIVGIGNYDGYREIDAEGKYVCPGLIDSHLHIESSMVTPTEFAKAIIPKGTTTIIADPHEIANVCGINGINFMLNQSKDVPMNIYFMMPSCVPSTPFENNGADLSAELIALHLANERILGLGEVMDYTSVINGKEEILKKIDLFDDKIIDGHSPNLKDKELNAYRVAGVMTDHECSTVEEAIERLRLGMYVQIREGSGAKNLEKLIKGLIKYDMNFDRCVFCTDDKHLDDIRKDGHISYNIKKAVKLGLNPIEAICMATINAANCYKLKRLGAVAPGYSADLLIFDSFEQFNVDKVFYRGDLVYENNEIKTEMPKYINDRNVLNTVRIANVTKEELKIKLSSNKVPVISFSANELLTKKEFAEVNIIDGEFVQDNIFSKVAVIERHKATGNIGLGIVKNFNIKGGAIASTVAHDSHNLIVIGDNDRDMLVAINELKRVNGGYTVVNNGEIKGTLELKVAGLMSDKSSEYVMETLNKMLKEARKLGINEKIDPFITLSFIALPVIPEIRITDQGLFDVTKFEFIKY